jgi:Beta-lactamase superfamily domain
MAARALVIRGGKVLLRRQRPAPGVHISPAHSPSPSSPLWHLWSLPESHQEGEREALIEAENRDFGVRHPSVPPPNRFLLFQEGKEEDEGESQEGVQLVFVRPSELARAFREGNAVFPSPLDSSVVLALASAENDQTQALGEDHTLYDAVRRGAASISNLDALEYASDTRILPVVSDTSMPFTLTNVITFQSRNGECMLVDPGCNADGSEAVRALLTTGHCSRERCPRLSIFLTHHHGDHTAGLDDVAQLRPDAMVYAHEVGVCLVLVSVFAFAHLDLMSEEHIEAHRDTWPENNHTRGRRTPGARRWRRGRFIRDSGRFVEGGDSPQGRVHPGAHRRPYVPFRRFDQASRCR